MMFLNQFKEFRYSFLGLVYLFSLLPPTENSVGILCKVIAVKGMERARKAAIFNLHTHCLASLLS